MASKLLDGEFCTKVGLLVNIALTMFKLFAGIYGHSRAMIADSIHSATDVLATGIVFVGVKISNSPPDKSHPYGHGNADTIASMMVALILLATGVYLGYSAVHVFVHKHMTVPSKIALYAAVVSIVVKELLYQYTIRVGKKLNSQAITANAWDHRSDAFSSIPAFIGILVARIWEKPIFDPIASFVIAILILKISLDLMHASVDIIMDESPRQEIMNKIAQITSSIDGVDNVHDLRVHQRGPSLTVDVKIEVDGNITVKEGHDIATRVKEALLSSELRINDVMVHINPTEYKDDSHQVG